jgi:predicted nucleic acid-binding Zn ribbon protein
MYAAHGHGGDGLPRIRATETKACPVCGKSFLPKWDDAVYDSTRCRLEASKRRRVKNMLAQMESQLNAFLGIKEPA